LLDTACGCSAMTIQNKPSVTPTMDLRLDYMRPAQPHKPIYVEAKVYRQSSNVIFCRGVAWQDDRENPIAHCVANFMKVDSKSIQFRSIAMKRLRRLMPWRQASVTDSEQN
jgi:acyl-coenzyme A thioesterase PaaI-like protein